MNDAILKTQFEITTGVNILKGVAEYIDTYLKLKVISNCAFNIASFIINYNLLESQGSCLIEDIFFFSITVMGTETYSLSPSKWVLIYIG